MVKNEKLVTSSVTRSQNIMKTINSSVWMEFYPIKNSGDASLTPFASYGEKLAIGNYVAFSFPFSQ